MPPRRSARVAAEAERVSSALSPLPLLLVLQIFGLLPVDARARAACVCRGWCHVLSELSLWTRLDMSPSSGVALRMTDAARAGAFLAGAARKARGQLQALDVACCEAAPFGVLLTVVQANGDALRELCAGASESGYAQSLDVDCVQRLLQAAPQLTSFHANVGRISSVADARRMLRNEPPFGQLRLRSLRIAFGFENFDDDAPVVAVAGEVVAHASLTRVELLHVPLHVRAALDAVVDMAGRLTTLVLENCDASPAVVPAMARLLGSRVLTGLYICETDLLLDAPSAALLGDALRANSTLTSLGLSGVDLWSDAGAAAALLRAVTGHVSIARLDLSQNEAAEADEAAVGAALGALVAANAPALTQLGVWESLLGDAALRPLFVALRRNTHLQLLDVTGEDMSDAFSRRVLLPAVRANTSLRVLRAIFTWEGAPAAPASLHEAEALVAARFAAAA
jgi:hypothetical protein